MMFASIAWPTFPRRCGGTNDGNRGGRKNRAQRGDRADVVALADPLPDRLRGDVERQGHLTPRPSAPDDEAAVELARIR